MKKYVAGLLTGLLISLSLTTFAAVKLEAVPSPFPILINGTKADIEAYNIKGSTYLKLADLKAVGVDAKFNSDKKQIEINTIGTSSRKAETVLNETVSESTTETSSVLEATSSRTVDGLTVYMAGGEEYVYRYDIANVLQNITENDNKQNNYKENIKSSSVNIEYYLALRPEDIVRPGTSNPDFVIFIVGKGSDWQGETAKPIELSEPIKETYIIVDKHIDPRLSVDKRNLQCIKFEDYEKYIKPILNLDKTLKEIYDMYAK